MATLLQSTTFLSRKADGTPNALGKLYTYAAGTLTPTAAYTTAALSVEHTNPITLDAAGTATVWLDASLSYRLIEKTAAEVTIRDTDNVYTDPADSRVVSAMQYGATGDGTTDDTAAIQAALDTGKDVFVPGTSDYYLLTDELTMLDNQRIYGEGARSQLRQTTTGKNVIKANAKTGCVVENLGIYCNGGVTSYLADNGIVFQASTRCTARGNYIQNHRGAGVHVYASDDCIVDGNTFANSPVADLDLNGDSLADIAVTYSSSRNRIYGNVCNSGQATGVILQSILSTDNCDDNIVTGNVIANCKGYGVAAYRLDLSGTVNRTVISNNAISNVTGTVENEALSNYSFGSGIYIQGAENTAVSGNTITGTHSGAVTHAESLAPGAIGTTNVTRVSITGNTIDTAGEFGIYVGDPNTVGEATGFAAVTGNIVSNTSKSAIKVINRGRVLIHGNTIDTVAGNGVWIANTTSNRPDISVIGNSIRNITGTSGIDFNYVDTGVISGNTLDTLSTHGISASQCTGLMISGNTIKSHTSRGITLADANVLQSVLRGNTIRGTGSSAEGIRLTSSPADEGANYITGCTARYAGTYAPWATLTVDSTTPSVAGGTTFVTNNTVATTITSFTNGTDRQEITVTFADANTTLDFSSSNLKGNGGVDRAMAANDVIRAIYRADVFAWYVTVIDV